MFRRTRTEWPKYFCRLGGYSQGSFIFSSLTVLSRGHGYTLVHWPTETFLYNGRRGETLRWQSSTTSYATCFAFGGFSSQPFVTSRACLSLPFFRPFFHYTTSSLWAVALSRRQSCRRSTWFRWPLCCARTCSRGFLNGHSSYRLYVLPCGLTRRTG